MDKYIFSLKRGVRSHTANDNKCGIYGIYIENKLVYIGQTSNNFLSRYSTHKSKIKVGFYGMYEDLKKAILDNKEVSFQPIYICEKNNDIRKIEEEYIKKYIPIYNQEGITQKYRKY